MSLPMFGIFQMKVKKTFQRKKRDGGGGIAFLRTWAQKHSFKYHNKSESTLEKS